MVRRKENTKKNTSIWLASGANDLIMIFSNKTTHYNGLEMFY